METGDWPTLIAVITGAVSLVLVMLFQLTRLNTTIWLMSTRCEHATRRLRAVADEALIAHHQLSAAIVAACDLHGIRQIARVMEVSPMTAQRWREAMPGTAAIARALAAARRNGAA